MKLLFALIMVLALALWTFTSSGQVHAFFDTIANSLGNTISSAKIFMPKPVLPANHLVVNEVLYETVDDEDIYKQAGKNRGQWVEIYNPTSSPVDLSGWTLEENAGSKDSQKLEGILQAGAFLLIIGIPVSDFKAVWGDTYGALIIETTSGTIGDGLDPLGDTLILKDKNGKVIDKMSWGNDISGFVPNCKNLCPTAPSGESLERSPLANDTDKKLDFVTRKPPTPGRSAE